MFHCCFIASLNVVSLKRMMCKPVQYNTKTTKELVDFPTIWLLHSCFVAEGLSLSLLEAPTGSLTFSPGMASISRVSIPSPNVRGIHLSDSVRWIRSLWDMRHGERCSQQLVFPQQHIATHTEPMWNPGVYCQSFNEEIKYLDPQTQSFIDCSTVVATTLWEELKRCVFLMRCRVTCEHQLNDKAILKQLHGLLAPSEPLANSAGSHLVEHATRLKDNFPYGDWIGGNLQQVKI